MRTWIYAGSAQTLEYVTVSELRAALAEQGLNLKRAELHSRARELLQASTAPHQWLAALADEGGVFVSADPEDEQLLRVMDRFPRDAIRLLTRDSVLIDLAAQQDRIRPQLETSLHRVLHHATVTAGPASPTTPTWPCTCARSRIMVKTSATVTPDSASTTVGTRCRPPAWAIRAYTRSSAR